MEKKFDVTALGELLIDVTENGISSQGNPMLEANPGGAPCNVLAMLQKLGKKTSFIGKVGKDQFGRMLKETIESVGIDSGNLIMDTDVHTTLAFVHTFADGDRDFSFYRNPGADMMLTVGEVQRDRIEASKLFHFGTLSSTHKQCREATRYAIQCAKAAGVLVSFDPNLREPLWADPEDAKREIAYGLENADIVKISDNEVVFMTGEKDYERAARILQEKYRIPLLFLTLGREGSRAYYKDMHAEAAGFIQEDTIETTGAGDTFTGCVLSRILERGGIDKLSETELKDMLVFANAGASLITTRRGALKVMPEREEIEDLVEKRLGGAAFSRKLDICEKMDVL